MCNVGSLLSTLSMSLLVGRLMPLFPRRLPVGRLTPLFPRRLPPSDEPHTLLPVPGNGYRHRANRLPSAYLSYLVFSSRQLQAAFVVIHFLMRARSEEHTSELQ